MNCSTSLFTTIENTVADLKCAGKTAIASDDTEITYGELIDRVNGFAERLAVAGIGSGHVLLGYLDNEPAFLVALLASTKAGCTFAPLDTSLTEGEISAVLKLTQSDLVVCDDALVEQCESFSKNLIGVNPSGEVNTVRVAHCPRTSLSADIACIQFTSGSTASSKGILLSREAFFYRSYYLMQALGLNDGDRTICTLPLTHTHGAECLALPTLLAGGTLYLKSPKFSFPLYILEELERLQITFFSSIPQFYDFSVKIASDKKPDLSALKHPFCGSAALAKTTAEAFFEHYGVHIKQGYGLAELSVICMNQHGAENIVYDSIGQPIEGVEWKIKGDETTGELMVRSKALFSGYLNDEVNTLDKLQNGWLHTGDVVSVDPDGLFRVVGRKEDFVKINGFKVYASEVESEIIGIDWVKECAVLFEKDELGSERIVPYIVPNKWELTEKDMEKSLIRHLRGRISDYKIPKRCVVLEALPKNPLGKILKSKICA